MFQYCYLNDVLLTLNTPWARFTDGSCSKRRTNFSAKLIPLGKDHCNSRYPWSRWELSFCCIVFQNSFRENDDLGIVTGSPNLKNVFGELSNCKRMIFFLFTNVTNINAFYNRLQRKIAYSYSMKMWQKSIYGKNFHEYKDFSVRKVILTASIIVVTGNACQE